MLKLWGIVRREQAILRDAIVEPDAKKPDELKDYPALIGELCHMLDLARPVLLKKHLNDLAHFHRAVFKPEDFMESVDFDRFEVQVLYEKDKDDKKNKSK